MKINNSAKVLAFAMSLFIAWIGIASATEKVNRARFVSAHGASAGAFGNLVIPAHWEVDDTGAVDVYTVPDINGITNRIKQQIDELANPNGVIDQKVQAAETRLKDQVKTSIDNLPQRLLSDEAKKAIKDAVVAELKEENLQLRQDIQDLQKQINDLKHNGGRP